MKPAQLSTPKRDSLAADTVVQPRQRVRDAALGEEYFRRELASGLVVYEGGAADAINQSADVMRLPHGAAAPANNSMVHRMVGMNALWPRTRPRLLMWYTSPVGSTNAFNLRFQCRMFAIAGNTAPAVLFSTTLTPAGPAVGNDVLYTTVVGGAVIPTVPAPLRLAIARLGADANANDLDILLAVVVFEESA